MGPDDVNALIMAARYDRLEIAKLFVAGDVFLDARDSKFNSTALMVQFYFFVYYRKEQILNRSPKDIYKLKDYKNSVFFIKTNVI